MWWRSRRTLYHFASILPDDESDSDPMSRLDTPGSDRNDIVQEAIRHNARAIVWASHRLRHDNEFCMQSLGRRQAAVAQYVTAVVVRQ